MSNERVRADIDLSAVLFNMESMHRNLRPGVRMVAVVKTNGYGHGAVQIARRLEEVPYVWGFAVAAIEEALELREAGIKKPILILGYVFPSCYDVLAEQEIRPACFRFDMLRQLSDAGKKAGNPVRIHAAVDTGMSRIGVTPDEKGLSFIRRALELQKEGGLVLEGIFTHFAQADETDLENTHTQICRFSSFTDWIRSDLGYEIPLRHA